MEEESTKPLKRQRQELPPTHERVRARLDKLEITQIDLAAKLDRSQANISKALRGKNKEFLYKIVDYLVERYGDKRSEYYESAADVLANEVENLHEMGKLMKEINQKINHLNTTIKEVQVEQEKTREDIKNIKKTLNERKVR